MNLAISSFQRRIAKQFGLKPGQVMVQGIKSAEEMGAEIILADRYIQNTVARIWKTIGWKGKALHLMQVIVSIFSKESISEEELEKMKSRDMIDSLLAEFSNNF